MRILSQLLFRIGTVFLPLMYLRDLGLATNIKHLDPATRMKFRVNTFDKQAIFEVWRMKEYEHPNFTIGREDIIVDIGAHIGSFSIWAARQATSGSVYAYEPNAENFDLLVENKELNNLSNLFPHQVAISKRRGEARLYNSTYHNMTHSLFEPESPAYDLVHTISLGDIIDAHHLERINYLKIDAEGAEYEILLNASDEIMARIDKIFIEYHDYLDHGRGYKELVAFLAGNGFEIEIGASAFHRHILKLGLIKAHRLSS